MYGTKKSTSLIEAIFFLIWDFEKSKMRAMPKPNLNFFFFANIIRILLNSHIIL